MTQTSVDDVWHAALEGVLEAVWLVDERSLSITFANQAAASLTGLSSEQLVGMPMQELAATPEDVCFWMQPDGDLQRGIHSYTSVLHADGRLLPVERRVTRLQANSGNVLLVTMRDRSAQVVTEHELETLLSELRATLDSAADGMLVCDTHGGVRAFNQRLALLWDMPRDLLVQRNDGAVQAHMEAQVTDAAGYRQRLDVIASDPMVETSDILELRSGAIVERRSVPQIKQGRPAGRVFSFRDITRQAETQAGLRLAARVFESSLDAIFIADRQHRLMRMNPGCERMVARPLGPLVGQPAVELFGSDASATLMDQIVESWTQEGFWEGELWLPREGGTYCAVHLSWVALRDESGIIVQSIGFMRDLTLQHAAQKRIEELAYSDILTGLPNRLMLSRRVATAIEAAQASQSTFSLLFLDLDRFKIINDSLGHPFGDRVLQLVAERLQCCLRQTDMLCRLGGG